MVDIGGKIVDLRKLKNWDQPNLAKAIGASRDMVGKRREQPLRRDGIKDRQRVRCAALLPDRRRQACFYNKETVKSLEEIEALNKDTRNPLYTIIDTFVRNAKAGKAYAKLATN